MKIAFSIGANIDKYKTYGLWLSNFNSSFESLDLCYKFTDFSDSILDDCSGLVLSGGLDIEPARHGRGDLNSTVVFNVARDEFESKLIEKALERKLPILAICRGSQMFCVAMGGKLIVDIPSEVGDRIEHRKINGVDSQHRVEINSNSFLRKIIGVSDGIVNSLHHESAWILPPDFEATAFTEDGVIEGYEWKAPFGKQFFIAVQWHPEKMDWNSPFSKNLAERFLFECETFSQLFNKDFQ